MWDILNRVMQMQIQHIHPSSLASLHTFPKGSFPGQSNADNHSGSHRSEEMTSPSWRGQEWENSAGFRMPIHPLTYSIAVCCNLKQLWNTLRNASQKPTDQHLCQQDVHLSKAKFPTVTVTPVLLSKMAFLTAIPRRRPSSQPHRANPRCSWVGTWPGRAASWEAYGWGWAPARCRARSVCLWPSVLHPPPHQLSAVMQRVALTHNGNSGIPWKHRPG